MIHGLLPRVCYRLPGKKPPNAVCGTSSQERRAAPAEALGQPLTHKPPVRRVEVEVMNGRGHDAKHEMTCVTCRFMTGRTSVGLEKALAPGDWFVFRHPRFLHYTCACLLASHLEPKQSSLEWRSILLSVDQSRSVDEFGWAGTERSRQHVSKRLFSHAPLGSLQNNVERWASVSPHYCAFKVLASLHCRRLQILLGLIRV